MRLLSTYLENLPFGYFEFEPLVNLFGDFFSFQLQNEKRRLEKDLEEIKRQKEEQEEENERLKQDVASLRYVDACKRDSLCQTHTIYLRVQEIQKNIQKITENSSR